MTAYNRETIGSIFFGLRCFETRDVFLQMQNIDSERYLRIGQHLTDVLYSDRYTEDYQQRVFVKGMRILRRYLIRYGVPSEVLTDNNLIRHSKSIEVSDFIDTQLDHPPSIN